MQHTRLSLVASVAFAALLCEVSPALAQTAVTLGSANSFAVLAGSTVTNTGPSNVSGEIGVSPTPGDKITGFPPGVQIGGTQHEADAVSAAAQTSLTAAYAGLDQPCTQTLTGEDLGSRTLYSGVYCYATSAQLTGTLTLDGQGNANATFIFKIGSTLTTASNAAVLVINSGQNCNVFWRIGSSATLGTDTLFSGNILAQDSITLNNNANVVGRALARTGAVTMDTNDVSVSNCAAVVPPAPVCPIITIAPETLPNGVRDVAYSQTITASGGTAPYTITLRSGTLPAGLTLTAAGVLSGTPTTAGIRIFTVRGTDTNGCFRDRTYTITIPSAFVCPPITLSPITLPRGTLGVAYSQTMAASGGNAPYHFTVTSGELPVGLTLSTSSPAPLTGTPTNTGTYTFTIRATDSNDCFTELPYTIVIGAPCPPITLAPATVPNGTVGVAYSQTITGSGGTAPYSFEDRTGTLPPGLTLTTAGVLAGTPTTAGTYTFTIRGTDAVGCYAERTYTIIFVSAAPTLSQWGVLLLAAGLVGLGSLRLRRRSAGAARMS